MSTGHVRPTLERSDGRALGVLERTPVTAYGVPTGLWRRRGPRGATRPTSTQGVLTISRPPPQRNVYTRTHIYIYIYIY